jgi:hypothetical protein
MPATLITPRLSSAALGIVVALLIAAATPLAGAPDAQAQTHGRMAQTHG